MQTAFDKPRTHLLEQIQQVLRGSKNIGTIPARILSAREARERGGSDCKMDSAEDYKVTGKAALLQLVPTALAPEAPKPRPDLRAGLERLAQREQSTSAAWQRAEDQLHAGQAAAQDMDAPDALDVLDALYDLATDYAHLARRALAQGEWALAGTALEHSKRLEPPRGEDVEAWRMARAAAHLGAGEADEAEALLRRNSAHATDLAAAWRTLASQFKAWNMPELVAKARALGGQQCQATQATLAEALSAGESADALANRVELTPQQLEAYRALQEAFPE